MIADSITFSRIPLSVLLLLFPQHSYPFAVFYLLCGVTDVLDGVVARKLHTESETGAMLDSIADLIFAVIYAVRILPMLSVPCRIWIWTVLIAVVKIYGILRRSKQKRRFYIPHSAANKLTGILIFVLPISTYFIDVKYSAAVVCLAATYAAAV